MKINSIEELFEFISDNEKRLLNIVGDCASCPQIEICKKDYKKGIISSVLSLDDSNTRFPLLLKLTKRFSLLLNMIPEAVYEKVYGYYNTSLPCPFLASEVIKNKEEITQAYNLLSDSESKKLYLNLLMYRMTLDKSFLEGAQSKYKQYFIESYSSLGEKENVVDCGAFNGDTLREYLLVNKPPKNYYAYEPDKKNLDEINALTKTLDLPTNFVLSDKGLYKKNTSLWFVEGKGTGSFASETQKENAHKIDVVCIDEDIDNEVSLIKMDIEGFEKSAIEGAKEHINQSYPKLAVCIYHSINDLWEIPLLINRLFPNYKNYIIQHHTDNFRETVLYVYND